MHAWSAVKSERRKEATAAADKLGVADISSGTFGDYPLNLTPRGAVPPQSTCLIRAIHAASSSSPIPSATFTNPRPSRGDGFRRSTAAFVRAGPAANHITRCLARPAGSLLFEPHAGPSNADWNRRAARHHCGVGREARGDRRCMAAQEHLWGLLYPPSRVQRRPQAAAQLGQKDRLRRGLSGGLPRMLRKNWA